MNLKLAYALRKMPCGLGREATLRLDQDLLAKARQRLPPRLRRKSKLRLRQGLRLTRQRPSDQHFQANSPAHGTNPPRDLADTRAPQNTLHTYQHLTPASWPTSPREAQQSSIKRRHLTQDSKRRGRGRMDRWLAPWREVQTRDSRQCAFASGKARGAERPTSLRLW